LMTHTITLKLYTEFIIILIFVDTIDTYKLI